MKKRTKVSFTKAGGGAGKNTYHRKLEIPAEMARNMGISRIAPHVVLDYDVGSGILSVYKDRLHGVTEEIVNIRKEKRRNEDLKED